MNTRLSELYESKLSILSAGDMRKNGVFTIYDFLLIFTNENFSMLLSLNVPQCTAGVASLKCEVALMAAAALCGRFYGLQFTAHQTNMPV